MSDNIESSAYISDIAPDTEAIIKSKSAEQLPINPSSKGMRAEDIKKAFYAPITDVEYSVMAELKRIIREANAALNALDIKKVDHVEGKGLSTNDFSDEYKQSLDALKNVPEWALSPTKPTYTASEVGAVSAENLQDFERIIKDEQNQTANAIKSAAVGKPTLVGQELVFPDLNGTELTRVTIPSGSSDGTSVSIPVSIPVYEYYMEQGTPSHVLYNEFIATFIIHSYNSGCYVYMPKLQLSCFGTDNAGEWQLWFSDYKFRVTGSEGLNGNTDLSLLSDGKSFLISVYDYQYSTYAITVNIDRIHEYVTIGVKPLLESLN